jgi:hypothetical protein
VSWDGDGHRDDTVWRPYDAAELARIAAPDAAVAVLTGRGLPDDAYE